MYDSPQRPSCLSLPLRAYPLSALVLLFISTTAIAQGQSQYPELPRFHQVSERLFRGAQPREGGIRRLAELGVNTIVNLRGTDARTRADEAEARSLGLKYFNVPLPTWGRPEDSRVQRVLEIIAAPESGRVFVHCKDGVDRTGMIVALQRITMEGWLPNEATAEAMRNGMRRYQFWKRDYINDYYVRWQRAPEQKGQFHAGEVENDIEDTIGTGVRVSEQAVFRLQKSVIRLMRRVRAL